MRVLVALLLVASAGRAAAQYPSGYQQPWGYQQPQGYQQPWSYQQPQSYQPYGGQYAPPAPTVPRGPPASLARGMLAAHNAIRAQTGVPPLVWSAQLAAAAQEWATYLAASHGFGHRPNNRYGENIYAISGDAASPDRVVATWGEEVRGYDIRRNACAGVCGHYTQIVWRTTRMVGCGVGTDAEREIWVCEYDPPGNIVGDRPY